MKKSEENELYVRLDEPIALRRELLLCRKEVLQILHKSERLKIIRKMKAELMDDVRKSFRDVYYLNNKLRSMIPITHLRSIQKEIPKSKKAKTQSQPVSVPPRVVPAMDRELSHMEHIEEELRDIEKRLDRL